MTYACPHCGAVVANADQHKDATMTCPGCWAGLRFEELHAVPEPDDAATFEHTLVGMDWPEERPDKEGEEDTE